MEAKSDSNEVDSGGGSDELDKSASEKVQPNGGANVARKKSISNGKCDRGMVSLNFQPLWTTAKELVLSL